ncbi:MAG: hypothetical protein ABJC05_05125 [Pyrinomonadaceae bacterium]
MKKSLAPRLLALPLIVLLSVVPVLADTIRLKDGSVLRGQVIGFKDQQFTILLGSGARGRRSRIMVYMDEVESIEFDAATTAAAASLANDDTGSSGNIQEPAQQSTRPSSQPSIVNNPTSNTTRTANAPTFFQVNVRVRGDNAGNGWTNSGLVVRRGQRLRINASGRVTMGGGRFSTPEGVPGLPDRDKLMRNQPTGGLIAVIGDDNDDFIFVGANRDFVAQRDGVLFLGVNEGNLSDNTGYYDAVIDAEAASGTGP